jgi:hypothetical protein
VRLLLLIAVFVTLTGCARVHNYGREDGPSMYMAWSTTSGDEIYAEHSPSVVSQREWEQKSVVAPRGEVVHGPLYFEDPFEDKGAGRREQYIGWEDGVAFPYSLGRFLLNFMLLPASMVVTPPWTPMESDGEISRQLLGYDHDAIRVNRADREVTHAVEKERDRPVPPKPDENEPQVAPSAEHDIPPPPPHDQR